MKIRSHTGNEVEARVGMVVKYFLGTNNPLRPMEIKEIYEDFAVLDDGDFYNLGSCVFVHKPYEYGDEIQVKITVGDQEEWIDDENFYPASNPNIEWRHANPSLRDAPDYAPEDL